MSTFIVIMLPLRRMRGDERPCPQTLHNRIAFKAPPWAPLRSSMPELYCPLGQKRIHPLLQLCCYMPYPHPLSPIPTPLLSKYNASYSGAASCF